MMVHILSLAHILPTGVMAANAISDIRNLASFAAATHFMVPMTNYNLIINVDATQCRTSGEITKKVRVVEYRYTQTDSTVILYKLSNQMK